MQFDSPQGFRAAHRRRFEPSQGGGIKEVPHVARGGRRHRLTEEVAADENGKTWSRTNLS